MILLDITHYIISSYYYIIISYYITAGPLVNSHEVGGLLREYAGYTTLPHGIMWCCTVLCCLVLFDGSGGPRVHSRDGGPAAGLRAGSPINILFYFILLCVLLNRGPSYLPTSKWTCCWSTLNSRHYIILYYIILYYIILFIGLSSTLHTSWRACCGSTQVSRYLSIVLYCILLHCIIYLFLK